MTAGVSTNFYLENGYEDYKDRYNAELVDDNDATKVTTFRLTVKGKQRCGGLFFLKNPPKTIGRLKLMIQIWSTALFL